MAQIFYKYFYLNYKKYTEYCLSEKMTNLCWNMWGSMIIIIIIIIIIILFICALNIYRRNQYLRLFIW
jgi:ABC-type transport system involved in cytochrome bd biosynthesis fused ATPase/permease subunit